MPSAPLYAKFCPRVRVKRLSSRIRPRSSTELSPWSRSFGRRHRVATLSSTLGLSRTRAKSRMKRGYADSSSQFANSFGLNCLVLTSWRSRQRDASRTYQIRRGASGDHSPDAGDCSNTKRRWDRHSSIDSVAIYSSAPPAEWHRLSRGNPLTDWRGGGRSTSSANATRSRTSAQSWLHGPRMAERRCWCSSPMTSNCRTCSSPLMRSRQRSATLYSKRRRSRRR